MVGISYPGISQLFTATMRPPHLAAIAPLSVISDTGRGTLRPGGIFNDGFALSWASDRQHDAQAAPASGQSWAGNRIRGGDTVCAANQALRSQAPDVLQMIEDHPLLRRARGDAHARPPGQPDQRARLPCRRVAGRADRPVLRQHARQVHRDRQGVVLGDERRPHRLARSRDPRPLDRVPPDLRRASRAEATADRRRGRGGDRTTGVAHRRSRCRPTVSRTRPRWRRHARRSRPTRGSASCSRTVRAPRRACRTPRFEGGFSGWPVPGTQARPWYFGSGSTLVDGAPAPGRFRRVHLRRRARARHDVGRDRHGLGVVAAAGLELDGTRGRQRGCVRDARRSRPTP